MLKGFQIAVLIVSGLMVFEAALWISWSNSVDTFSFTSAALIGYASLISVLFFGDKIIWLGKVLGAVWSALLSNKSKALITLLVSTILCALGGIEIYEKWETKKFNVVFEVDLEETLVNNDSSMEVENIHTQEKYVSAIDVSGRGRFSLPEGAAVQISARIGTRHYVFQPITIDEPIFYKSLDLENAERTSFGDMEQASTVSSYVMPRSYFRNVNMNNTSDSDADYEKYVKFGLPGSADLVEKKGYIFSFNSLLRIPNWTAYWIRGQAKTVERPLDYLQEPLIDAFLQASSRDYSGSGYDRGHMVALADMNYLGAQETAEAHNMATVLPQSRFVNRRTWLELEEFARTYAENGVGIIAGPAFMGENDKVQMFTIGSNDVAVPTHLFRIIYRVSQDSSIDALSFLVPNSDSATGDIHEYLVSIDTIEELTGLDFFNQLGSLEEALLEKSVPAAIWNAP